MMAKDDSDLGSMNPNAVTSLIASLPAIVSLCIALVPIPFTGHVCFPAAAFLAALAVVTGFVSMLHMRSRGERGHGLAVLGLALGGLVVVPSVCLAVLGIVIWSRLAAIMPALAM